MKNLLLTLLVISSISLKAQTTYTYTGEGSWDTEANWSPSYPGIIISANDIVQLEGFIDSDSVEEIINYGTINVNGTNSDAYVSLGPFYNIGTVNLVSGSLQFNQLGGIGTINIDANSGLGVFIAGGGDEYDGTINNMGSIGFEGNSSFIMNGEIYNYGAMYIDSPYLVFYNGSTLYNYGLLAINTFIDIDYYFWLGWDPINMYHRSIQNDGTIENYGTIDNNWRIENTGYIKDNGTMINYGKLSNYGLISGENISHVGDFNNEYILSPGLDQSTGTYTFNDNLIQDDFTDIINSNPTIAIDIESISSFDVVAVNGAATLIGTLNINLLNNFKPNVGDTFTILTANSISGTFTTVNLPQDSVWNVNYTATEVILEYVSPLEVTSFIPTTNALNVNNTSNIDVTFNGVIDATTITPATVKVLGNQGEPLTFSNQGSGQLASINPNRDFFPGEVITTTLTTGIEANSGEPLIMPYTYQFTTAVSPNSPGEFPLGQNNISTAEAFATSVSIGDLNGDGYLDVVSSSNTNDRIAWFANDGSGTFGVRQTISVLADGANNTAVADIDGDGDLDVLSASLLDDRIAWYQNDGTGIFGAQQTITTLANGAQSVIAADLDGDGDLDVLSSSAIDDRVAWYKNDGMGAFGVQQNINTTADGASSVSAADIDGDGDLDVLSTSRFDNNIILYANDGNGNFTIQQVISTTAVGASTVTTADLDDDGHLDVLCASQGDNTIAWYKNDGMGAFGAQQVITTAAMGARNVVTGDMDGDGDLDVLSASQTDNRIAWYANDGSGTFGAQQTITTATSLPFDVEAADLDGDGDLDVLSASFGDNRIAWYENSLPDCSGGTTTYTIAGGWDNGAPNATMEAIINEDYTTSSVGLGSINACSLTVTNGATLIISPETFVLIEQDINVATGSSLEVAHTGSAVQVENAAIVTNNGTINVNVTTPTLQARDFMIAGSPMSTETREGVYANAYRMHKHSTLDFFPHPDVDAYYAPATVANFADDNFNNWTPQTGLLNPGEGYLVSPQSNGTESGMTYDLSFENGTLNNGAITFGLDFHVDQNSSPSMISNPYASAIDAEAFINANPQINEVYFWEHITYPDAALPGANNVNYSMQDISMFNLSGGIGAGTAATNGGTTPNGFIATSQGFGVKATAAGTATFNNAMRVTTGNTTLRTTETSRDRIWLTLESTAFGIASETLIAFKEGATADFDAGYDSEQIAKFVSLYSHIEDDNSLLGIQTREALTEDKEVSLGFSTQNEEVDTYMISIKELDGSLIESYTVYLEDHELGTITDISKTDYAFTASEGIYNNRFTLRFTDRNVLDTSAVALDQISVSPNPTDGVLTIQSPLSVIRSVSVKDVQGRTITQMDVIEGLSYTIDISEMSSAVYFIGIETEAGTITKRVIKK